MIDLPIYDLSGKKIDSLSIDEADLGGEVNPSLLKQAYVMFHANRRQGSARTKGRGQIEGSSKKMYKQKGTGNARMGNKRTNLRKGGGVAFAKTKTKEEFRLDMPKKMRRLANRNALLAKLVDSEVKCVADLGFKEPKTKTFANLLSTLGVDRSCLVALNSDERNAALSARNIPGVTTIRADQLNVFELLNHRYVLVDRDSLKAFLDGSLWNGEDNGKEAA